MNARGAIDRTTSHAVLDGAINQALAVLQDKWSLDLSGYSRERLSRHLIEGMSRLGLARAEDYVARLTVAGEEADRLFRACTVNVSNFFRDEVV